MKSRVVFMALLCLLFIFTGAMAQADIPAAPVPKANLVYTGEPQALYSDPENVGYYWFWDADGTGTPEWSTSIPTAVNAGTYTYPYYHKDVTPRQVELKSIIAPKEVTLTWSPDDETEPPEGSKTIQMTFNGKQERQPVAEIEDGIIDADKTTCVLSLTGDELFKVSDGVGTAEAAFSNTTCAKNYTITNSEQKFEIIPVTVNLTWEPLSFTYDGEEHVPTATYTDMLNRTQQANVSGAQTNANKESENYIATAKSDNSNYKFTNSTNPFTIIPAKVTVYVVGEKNEVTYDGQEHSVGYTIDKVTILDEDEEEQETDLYPESDDDIIYKGKSDKLTRKDADTYIFNITESHFENGNENFDVTFNVTKGQLIINHADVTLTWEGDEDGKTEVIELPFNGKKQSPKVSEAEGIVDADAETCSITVGGETRTKVSQKIGTAEASFSDESNESCRTNYTITNPGHDFRIVPVEVDLTWENTTLTYTGDPQAPTASYTDLSGRTQNPSVTPEETEVGSYKATAKTINGNYSFSNPTQDFSIVAGEVYVIWTEKTEFTYNGKTSQYPHVQKAYVVDDEENETEVSVTVTIEGRDGTTTELPNAGKYTAKAVLIDAENYTFASDAITTVDFVVNPRPVTLEWDKNSFVYNKEEQGPTATVTAASLMDGDSCEVTEYDGYQINVGTGYTATATKLSNENYALPEDPTHIFSITPKKVKFIWDTETELVYNGTEQAPALTLDWVFDGDECEVTEIEGKEKDADEDYTATGKALSNPNYRLPDNASVTYSISPLTAEFAWDNLSPTYNGKKQYPAATVSNLIGEDTCDVTVSHGKTEAGSGYKAEITGLSNTNYAIPTDGTQFHTWEILPYPVTLTWDKTEFDYTGQNQEPKATYKDVDGVEKSAVVSVKDPYADDHKNAGEYTAVASITDTNYEITNPEQAFTIGVTGIKITWSTPTEFTYNGSDQRPTVTNITDADGNKVNAKMTVTVQQDGADVSEHADAGTYTAVAAFNDTTNYKFIDESQATQEFTINPMKVTVEWSVEDNHQYTYNVSNQVPTVTRFRDENNQNINAKISSSTITKDGSEVNESIDAGKYVKTVVITDPNYKLAETAKASINYEIVPANLKAGWQNKTEFTYNGQDQAPDIFQFRDLNRNVEITKAEMPYTVTVDKNPHKDAGSYVATVEINNPNYVLTQNITRDYTIVGVSGTISFTEPYELTYTGEDLTDQIKVTVTDSDGNTITDPDLTITTSPSPFVNVGEYTVTAKSNNSNLTAEEKTETYQIIKADYKDNSKSGEVDDPNSFALIYKEELPYTGDFQNLIEDIKWNGSTSHGAFKFAVLDENDQFVQKATVTKDQCTLDWPVAKDIGTYRVYYYVEGDENHKDYPADDAVAGPFTVTITEADLANAEITLNPAVLPYTGDPVTANPTVTYNGIPLVLGEDYEITGNVETEVGTYTLTITAVPGSRFIGTVNVTWEIKDMVNRISMFRIGEPDKVCLRCGVLGGELPATGFPTRVNVPLAVKPQGLDYAELGMRIQIPSLNVDVELAGVPTMDGAWKVEWLADRAGLLSGTALPGDGYSIVAAHNTLNAEEVGPFVLLSALDENDTVFVNAADGSMKLFRVYANELLAPDDMETLASIAEQESNTLVLVTCENESVDGGYLNRRVVFAKPLN